MGKVRSWFRRRRRTLAAHVALLAVLALIIDRFRPLFPRMKTELPGNGTDVAAQHLFMAWQWLSLAELRLGDVMKAPIFHPFDYGTSFHEGLFGFSVLFSPVYFATGNTVAAYNAALVGAFVLTAAGLYVLASTLFRSPAAGVAAAVLGAFVTPRIANLTLMNLSAPYFALFGFAAIVAWTRKPSPRVLAAAVALMAVQFASAMQWVIVGAYVAVPWLFCVWASSGFKIDRRRVVHLGAGLAGFALLVLPWFLMHRQAMLSRHGLLRTQSMEFYRISHEALLAQTALVAHLKWFAVAGVALALVVRLDARRLRWRTRGHVVGLVAGLAMMFVFALGAYKRVGGNIEELTGLWAFRHLPGFDGFRVPSRLAMWTPYFACVFASGVVAAFDRVLARRVCRWWAQSIARGALALAPLYFVTWWPDVPQRTIKPIYERPREIEIARRVAALPADAAIVELPYEGVHVTPSDEWVLIHRRKQVGGQASVIPVLHDGFRALGNWPDADVRAFHALRVTHLVVPKRWMDDPATRAKADAIGYRVVDAIHDRAIVAVPPPLPASPAPVVVEAADRAAAGRWLTIARFDPAVTASLRGFHRGRAVWTKEDGSEEETVKVWGFVPGITGLDDPARWHVPVPAQPGRWRVRAEVDGAVEERVVEVVAQPTTFDAPITQGSIVAANPGPVTARARFSLLVPVRVTAGPGPAWLATSIEDVPDRRGEAVLLYQWRNPGGKPGAPATAWPFWGYHALDRDLWPGESDDVVWAVPVPAQPGRYELWARLDAFEKPGNAMPFVKVLDVDAVP